MSEIYQNEDGIQVQLLSREEANLITSFISQVGVWIAHHGEKADKIEIVYYPEDDGFEIVNNEENNGLLRRNRVSVFRGELIAWATQQTQQLKGWNNENTVTAFACIYKDGQFGAICQTQAKSSMASESDTDLAIFESDTGSGSLGD